MKKLIIVLLILLAAAGAASAILLGGGKKPDYIRIHIRANSNERADQEAKLAVRDKVTEYLIPLLASAEDKAAAAAALNGARAELTLIADGVLRQRGFSYRASVTLSAERFPARQYGDLVLDAGVYDALVIGLGEAAGDNWWCIAYPPLCFIPADNSGNVIYKSKIIELIERWKH